MIDPTNFLISAKIPENYKTFQILQKYANPTNGVSDKFHVGKLSGDGREFVRGPGRRKLFGDIFAGEGLAENFIDASFWDLSKFLWMQFISNRLFWVGILANNPNHFGLYIVGLLLYYDCILLFIIYII